MVRFKNLTVLRAYWEANEDWLKFYYPSRQSFSNSVWFIIKNYDLDSVVDIPKLKDIIVKTRKQNFG